METDSRAAEAQPPLEVERANTFSSVVDMSTNGVPNLRRLRLHRANRSEVVPVLARVEDLIGQEHPARLIWDRTGELDLSAFYEGIKVVEGEPGRPAIDPKILIALWVYATSQGVDCAREIGKLCVEHLAYIWICGGVSVNYHTISDFRTDHEAELDALMTQIVGHLDEEGLMDLEIQTQDGMRVRASAGAASFHRQPTLEKHLMQARERVKMLEEMKQVMPDEHTARQESAQERTAKERVERLEAALEEMPKVKAVKPAAKREEARVSSTDPEARVMKMADGGYRPAYNWEFAVELSHFVITGVDVVNIGSDKAQMIPMVEQVRKRTGRLPKAWLIDGGFVKLEAIETMDKDGVTVYAPVPKPKDKTRDRYAPLATDSTAIVQWRQRMGTEEGQSIYKQRKLVELPNAQARSRHGVQQVRVRGRRKVRCVALWVAITHNLLIWIRDRPRAAATSVPQAGRAAA
jgi:transposase